MPSLEPPAPSELMHIRTYQPSDEAAVVELWDICRLTRPWNDPRSDIARKLTVQPELFLVGEVDGKLMASAMGGFDGHRGWINYLAVHPNYQRRGFGQAMMRCLEQNLKERGCPKVNLQIRSANDAVVSFYRAIGYAQDDVVSLGRRLIEDEPAAAPHSRPEGQERAAAGVRQPLTSRSEGNRRG